MFSLADFSNGFTQGNAGGGNGRDGVPSSSSGEVPYSSAGEVPHTDFAANPTSTRFQLANHKTFAYDNPSFAVPVLEPLGDAYYKMPTRAHHVTSVLNSTGLFCNFTKVSAILTRQNFSRIPEVSRAVDKCKDCPDWRFLWNTVSEPCMASLTRARHPHPQQCSHYAEFVKCAAYVMKVNHYHCSDDMVRRMALSNYWYLGQARSPSDRSSYPPHPPNPTHITQPPVALTVHTKTDPVHTPLEKAQPLILLQWMTIVPHYYKLPSLVDLEKTEVCANPDAYQYILRYHCANDMEPSSSRDHDHRSSRYDDMSSHYTRDSMHPRPSSFFDDRSSYTKDSMRSRPSSSFDDMTSNTRDSIRPRPSSVAGDHGYSSNSGDSSLPRPSPTRHVSSQSRSGSGDISGGSWSPSHTRPAYEDSSSGYYTPPVYPTMTPPKDDDLACISHPSTMGAAPVATAGYVTALRPARCTCNRGWGGGGGAARTGLSTASHNVRV
ncbi:hypothetical protein ACOMHN_022664 [Nucella lapillus]